MTGGRTTFLRAAALAAAGLLSLAGCGSSSTPSGGSPSPTGATATGHEGHTSTSGPGVTQSSRVALSDGGALVSLPLPGGPYTPKAPNGGTDDYRCFLVDPQVTASTFLTGVQFVPGNAPIVHHVILYRVDKAQVAAAQAKDAADPGTGWTCFGGTGIPNTDRNPLRALDSAPWLAAWAPGGKETRFGAGTGVPMAAGSRIVMQVHYNLLGGTGSDNSGVRLRLAPPGTSLLPLETMLLVAPVELPCAPAESGALCDRSMAVADVVRRFGADAGRTVAGLQLLCGGTSLTNPTAGPTQHCDRRVQETVTVRAAAAHMHLLGRALRIELNPGTARATVLLDVPQYDFDNQGARPLATPVTVHPGDVLRVTCTHDATLRAALPALRTLPPRYVVWGEGTSDEMCLGILSVTR